MRFDFLGARFLLVLVFVLLVLPRQPLAAPSDERPDYASWPHEGSDVHPDPAVRFGVLPNGVRYALMRNSQPAGTISLRLRIAAGSLQERDEQQGLAHFIEHMAFNGSKNVPEGEFVKLLQRKGLAFGADTNAYTSFGETVYKLDLPKNDSDLVDTGLMLFREIGDRLTFDVASIEREKGVVLSEQRTRNTPELRELMVRFGLWYEGQRQAVRFPIGKVETIKGATRALLLDYYQAFYRPERALLVATGDFDIAALEAKIKAKFSDWHGKGKDPADPEQGPVKQRGLAAGSYVDANLPESTMISWFDPPDNSPDSVALRMENGKRGIGSFILFRRLTEISRGEKPPFFNFGGGFGNQRRLAKSAVVLGSSVPGTWRRALSSLEQEARRIQIHGVTQSEIDREVKEQRAQREDAVAKAATRETRSLADELIRSFNSRTVFTSPADALALFEQQARSLTPENVHEAVRAFVGAQGPVVFVSSGQPIAGGDAAIAEAYLESAKVSVAPPAAQTVKAFPYTDFGKTGRVADRRERSDLGLTTVRFANGVMLNIKPTTFEKDAVEVGVQIGGGFLHLPKDKPGLGIVLGQVLTEGGLKKLSPDELERAVAGRIVSWNAFWAGENAFRFSAQTVKSDLALQMQLLAAFTTDAAFRPGALTRVQAAVEAFLKQFRSAPDRVLSMNRDWLLESGDPREKEPTPEEFRALTISDYEAVLKPAFKSSPIEITIVGDVEIDAAIDAVAKTFGALSRRSPKLKVPAGADEIRFPASSSTVSLAHEGKPDQAAGFVAWAAPDFYSNPRRARAISLLSAALKVRMVDEFREAQGATYSPSASAVSSLVFRDFGYIQAEATTRPDLVEGFFTTVDKIAAELKSGTFPDDLITRARNPMVDGIETARHRNGYWVNALGTAQSEPRSLDAVRSLLDDLRGITKEDLVGVAQAYLTDSRKLTVRVLPEAGERRDLK